uniref:Uncharacterized protein n=1 Tax=Ananas comosus var. bracteatus TaxID=296719 RepID=A0A6V7QPD3_ANACO|nr:unnamed protein product [Ananas comosus var. bracteatus]
MRELPFNAQEGKEGSSGVLVAQQQEQQQQQQQVEEDQAALFWPVKRQKSSGVEEGLEPRSVLDQRRSPSPPTSSSTLSSSLGGSGGGGGGGGACSSDIAGVAAVSGNNPSTPKWDVAGGIHQRRDEWAAAELQPIAAGLEMAGFIGAGEKCAGIIGVDEWDAMLSESAASPAHEQSFLRWIMGEADDPAALGITRQQQQQPPPLISQLVGAEFDGGANVGLGFGIPDLDAVGAGGIAAATAAISPLSLSSEVTSAGGLSLSSNTANSNKVSNSNSNSNFASHHSGNLLNHLLLSPPPPTQPQPPPSQLPLPQGYSSRSRPWRRSRSFSGRRASCSTSTSSSSRSRRRTRPSSSLCRPSPSKPSTIRRLRRPSSSLPSLNATTPSPPTPNSSSAETIFLFISHPPPRRAFPSSTPPRLSTSRCGPRRRTRPPPTTTTTTTTTTTRQFWTSSSRPPGYPPPPLGLLLQTSPQSHPRRSCHHPLRSGLLAVFGPPQERLLHPTGHPHDVAFKLAAYKEFSEVSPVLQFANFTATQALLEELGPSADRIHIIDFDIGVGGQWSSFMQELAQSRRCTTSASASGAAAAAAAVGAAPLLKLTAFVSPSSYHPLELHLTRDNLTHFAAELQIPFEFNILPLDSFDPAELLSMGKEAIAVNLPIGCGHGHAFPTLLRLVKQLFPKIVISIDHSSDRGELPFGQHFFQAFQSCLFLLDSIDSSGISTEITNRIEHFLLQPRIERAIIGRHSAASKMMPWRTLFTSAGFVPVHFSNFAETQAECLLKRVQVRGFHVEKRQSSLSLYWQRGSSFPCRRGGVDELFPLRLYSGRHVTLHLLCCII